MSFDGEKNEVILGPERDLYRSVLWASQVNYTGQLPIGPTRVTAKIRYKASESAGLLLANGKWAELRFDEPQKAVTPGQAVVFYSGEEVMGGGYIEIRQPNGGSVADETHENVASS